MRVNKLIAVLLAALVAESMVTPAAAWSDTSGSQSVELMVEVNEEWTVVAVEHGGEAAAGADVTVDTLATADVGAEGEYQADAEGTVRVLTPDADATATVEVESDNLYAAGTVTLQASDGEERTYTVEIEAEGDLESETSAATFSEVALMVFQSVYSVTVDGSADATAEPTLELNADDGSALGVELEGESESSTEAEGEAGDSDDNDDDDGVIIGTET